MSLGDPSTSFFIQEKRKKDEVRNGNMAKVIAQLDFLTKHVMGLNLKVVNVFVFKGTKAYDDDNM